MPKQKDLKRAVRARMQKTGESYTAARLQLVRKKEASYAEIAGMSDDAVKQKSGRNWAGWVKTLDAIGASGKPHAEIARYVASLGVPSWWSQMITVGYERIRGLRKVGQMRSGTYSTTKSRTFNAPVERLFAAFSDQLPAEATIRTARANRSMRVTWHDGTSVAIGFTTKTAAKSIVAIEHSKLPDKAAADRVKAMWSERLDALAAILA